MKAAPFEYYPAHSLEHGLQLLKEYGDDVKLIAGGQSLVPMMAMRLAKPGHLVDIHRLSELQDLQVVDGFLRTGATVKQCTLEFSPKAQHIPLFGIALPWIGHQQTRNRGTVGGSLAHADPSAELPLIATILGANIHFQSIDQGKRHCLANELFLGPMWTNIDPQECLTHIDWPIWSGTNIGFAFEETSIRQGDFAMASAATQLQLDAQQKVIRMTFGLGGMGGTPYSFNDLSQSMIGHLLNNDAIDALAEQAVKGTEPASDLHASAPYRRNLAKTLLKRTMQQAVAMALTSTPPSSS
jgi:carbon-monoxide dehydrogenase medium subunit/2-furoyl-CoA dehydrogenase FAD binding subunit